MKWILTKADLPETRQDVLFCTNFGREVRKGRFVKYYENEKGIWENVFISDDGGFYLKDGHSITHWMPSPEPIIPD